MNQLRKNSRFILLLVKMAKTFYPLKVGLFGIGLNAYWEQFDGLKERLESYIDIVEKKLSNFKTEVINLGLIDTNEKAIQAGHLFRQKDVDIIFLYTTTYALSSTVLPIVQLAKLPVIVLNLSPDAAIDYKSFNKITDRTKMTVNGLPIVLLAQYLKLQMFLTGRAFNFTR
jgi:L-arabinose isomerase